MTGAAINAAGIVAGGLCAFAFKKAPSNRFQLWAKMFLGLYTVLLGLELTWKNLNGTFGQVIKELAIVLLAMTLGKMIGRLLRLQQLSNAIGQFATRILTEDAGKKQFNSGFLVATALFCAAPLAILAPTHEGFADSISPLFVVKAFMDGVATMVFCAAFGWSPIVSAVPVLAFEGLLTQCARLLEPMLRHQPAPLVESINATNGLLIFCVALLIFEIKKVRVAEYLPSLAVAPLLIRWLW